MDLEFTPEQEAFRQEVRAFLERELPPNWEKGFWMEPESDEWWTVARRFQRRLGEKGWMALSWPKEFHGLGATLTQQLIFNEESAYYGAPGRGFGPLTVAPALMLFGSKQQQADHLPKIRTAEVHWCQHFSEPEAGSDLASLRTRAVDMGDHWIIDGAKIWQHDAAHSEWTYLAARTDPSAPKHKGISTFIFPMDLPGISVQPIVTLGGNLNSATFFDNVKIPKDALLGTLNRGWYQMASTLDFERSGIDRTVSNLHNLELLTEYVKTTTRNGKLLSQDPIVRQKLADLDIAFQVGRLLAYRVSSLQDKTGKMPNHEAALSKLWGSELSQKLSEAAVQILGMSGTLLNGAKNAPLRGRIERLCLISRGDTIRGGTSEIQRIVIATRGLGMPR